MQPVLRLLTTQPQLLADHAQAYAELVTLESARLAAQWQRRALLAALAVGAVLVAAVLVGVAVLLWAVLPVQSAAVAWIFIAVPLLPLVAAWVCWWAARSRADVAAFAGVRQQLCADWLLLRQAGAA